MKNGFPSTQSHEAHIPISKDNPIKTPSHSSSQILKHIKLSNRNKTTCGFNTSVINILMEEDDESPGIKKHRKVKFKTAIPRNKLVRRAKKLLTLTPTSDLNLFEDKEEANLSFTTVHLINTLKKVSILKNIPYTKIRSMAKLKNYMNFKKEEIINVSPESNRLFVILSGEVSVNFNSKYLKTLSKLDFFGPPMLLFNSSHSCYLATTTYLETIYFDFDELLYDMNSNKLSDKLAETSLEDLAFNNFEFIKEIGKGGFSSVDLYRDTESGNQYAIKKYLLCEVNQNNYMENLKREHEILLQLEHPSVVKLYKTLNDETSFQFIMEYIRGKDLWEVMREIGCFNKVHAQFTAACILTILQYIHGRGVIYRDLKPENLMVTEPGYFKLIDFGIAKLTKDKTSTVIGTPHYMSPELIKGACYDHSIDYWSFGVCLYELVCGDVPFGAGVEDPMKIFTYITLQ